MTREWMGFEVMMLAALALAGCERKAAPLPSSEFTGTWSCESSIVLRYNVPAGKADRSSATRSTLTLAGNGSTLTATSVSPGGKNTPCQTTFTVNGSAATAKPGQVCNVTNADLGAGEIALTVTSSVVSVEGDTIHSLSSYTFSRSDPGVSIPETGTASGTAVCSRR